MVVKTPHILRKTGGRLFSVLAAALIVSAGPAGSEEDVPAARRRLDAGAQAETVLRRAFHAEHTGQDREAIGFFEEYFKQGQESAHARVEFSRVLSRSGRHERAIQEARRAREISAADPDVIVNLVRVLRKGQRQKEALSVLEDANRRFQDNGEIEFYLAEVYHDLGQKGPARVHYNQVLFHRENIGWRASVYRNISLWRLADLNYREGNVENARIFAVKYLRYNPDRLYARFFLGYHLYYRENDFDRARAELETILSVDEEQAERQGVDLSDVYAALGAIYFLNDDYHCLRFLRESINRKKEGTAILETGLLHAYKKEDEQALQYLVPFVKRFQQHFIARVAVLRILERMDRPDLLGDELRRVSLLAGRVHQNRIGLDLTRRAFALADDRNADAGLSRSELYQQMARHYNALGQPRRTIFYLRRALQAGDREGRWQKPGARATVMLGLARIMSESSVDRSADAIALCREVLAEDPEMHEAYFTLGLIRMKERKFDTALAHLSTAIEKARAAGEAARPALVSYYYFRAVARHELTPPQFDETVADLKQVLELNRDFPEANNFLGYIYVERGVNFQEARAYIERAVEKEPTRGAYQDSLGWLYFQTGEYGRARYHLQLAAMLLEEAGKADAVVYHHLGDVWLKLKYPRRAVLAYNQALRILNEKIETGANGRELERDRKLVVEIRKKIKEIGT